MWRFTSQIVIDNHHSKCQRNAVREKAGQSNCVALVATTDGSDRQHKKRDKLFTDFGDQMSNNNNKRNSESRSPLEDERAAKSQRSLSQAETTAEAILALMPGNPRDHLIEEYITGRYTKAMAKALLGMVPKSATLHWFEGRVFRFGLKDCNV